MSNVFIFVIIHQKKIIKSFLLSIKLSCDNQGGYSDIQMGSGMEFKNSVDKHRIKQFFHILNIIITQNFSLFCFNDEKK